MTTLYTENSEKWKALADIDYFTQFVKAWIPFNAWYKNYYPNIDSDREAINEIKSNNNKFRDRLISLLSGSDNESAVFKSYIANLHYELGRKYIRDKNGDPISFESIVIERNPIKIYTFRYKSIDYKAERGPGGRTEKEIEITVVSPTGIKFTCTQTNGFNLADLTGQPGFNKLSAMQRTHLEACYKEINPNKPVNLLTNDENARIRMGSFNFTNNTIFLCKGIIEILYKLRNALFHGEIVPDKDTNRVYEPAYQILNTLIQVL